MSRWYRGAWRDEPPRFRDVSARGVRIVIEDWDAAVRAVVGRMLAEAGYAVVDCGGPDSLRAGRCPLEEGAACPGIEAADVVVSRFLTGSPRERAILTAIRRQHAETPLVVEAPPITAQRFAGVLEGCVVLPRFTTAELRRAVDEQVSTTYR